MEHRATIALRRPALRPPALRPVSFRKVRPWCLPLFATALFTIAAPADAQQELPLPPAFKQLSAAGINVTPPQQVVNGKVDRVPIGGDSPDPFHVLDNTGSGSQAAAAGQQMVLVLRNGRVLQGPIRADSHGYFVESPESSVYIPIEQVRFVAADMHEAHAKLCKSISGVSARRDLVLGRWCLENNLRPEAAAHFRSALNFDPGSREARKGLARLEQLQSEEPAQVGPLRASASSDAPFSESLSRLSGSAVREFVLGIQPMLLARCGSVKCHGGNEAASPGVAAFHLEHVRISQGSNRAATARNLDAVLSLLDTQFPSQSALFQRGLQPHGGAMTRAPLDGPAGRAQEVRLRRWIDSIAPERNRLRREDASRAFVNQFARPPMPPTLRDPYVVPAGAAMRTAGNAVGPPERMAPPSDASTGFHYPADSPKQLGPLTDPFDPSQFNAGR
jgi:hypothetical protein